jgi:membrane dipeptidase
MKLSKSQEERAKELHKRCIVLDPHSDIPCEVIRRRALGETRILNNTFFKPLRKGGVDAVCLSTMPHIMHYPAYRGDYIQAGMHFMDVMLTELEECSDHFLLVKKAEDFLTAKKEGKIAGVLGFEGGDPCGDDLGNFRNFVRLGLREVQLTWNYRNQICDGIYESRNGGLTEYGRSLVKEMNRLNVLIDTSHINSRGLEDVIELSSQPVRMSHTCSKALVDHPRNITDEQAKMIAKKGGAIGVNFLPQFVAKKNATVEDVLNHIDHFVELVGSEHVGIGPDFIDYCLEVMLGALKGLAYDSGHTYPYPKGAEDATKLPAITRGLVARGYSDQDIENILGRSMVRLFKEVIG